MTISKIKYKEIQPLRESVKHADTKSKIGSNLNLPMVVKYFS